MADDAINDEGLSENLKNNIDDEDEGKTVPATDENLADDVVVIIVPTLETNDDKDVEETISAADDDAAIGVATLNTVDDHDVGETVSAADDDDADDEDVNNNFDADGTFDDDDTDRD